MSWEIVKKRKYKNLIEYKKWTAKISEIKKLGKKKRIYLLKKKKKFY